MPDSKEVNGASPKQSWLSQKRAASIGSLLVLLLGFGALILDTPLNERLKYASYDSSYLWWPLSHAKLPDSQVCVIYLDDSSTQYLGQSQDKPWDRSIHAKLLGRLTSDGVKAVVFDIIFSDPGPDTQADSALAEAIRSNGRVVLAAGYSRNLSAQETRGFKVIANDLIYTRETTAIPPYLPFLRAGALWGVPHMHPDGDFVVREHWHGLPGASDVSLSWAAARLIGLNETKDTNALSRERWINYYAGAGTVPGMSYYKALAASPGFFRDKIVFVGAQPTSGLLREKRDEWRSPYTTWNEAPLFYPAVDVHALCLMNLIRGDWLKRMSPAGEWLALLLASLAFGYALSHLRPAAAAGVAVLLVAAFTLASIFIFGLTHIWFPWLIIVAVQAPAGLLWSIGYKSIEWYVQRRALEEQRRKAEFRIREQAALLDKAQDAIMVHDNAGHTSYWNSSAERLYGWTAGEIRQQNVEELLYSREGDTLPAARETALNRGEWNGRLRQKTKLGKDIFVDSRWTKVLDEAGNPEFLIINTDVTEKTKLEAQLFRTQRMESIGTLAGGIAHDLNNVLSPIMMGVQLLEMKESDEGKKKMLRTIATSTQRGADMVKQVLTFARGQDGEKVLLQLKHVIREMEKMARETFPKSIEVQSNIAPDLQPIKGDATQIHQVLLNLCVNARDAMPEGGSILIEAKNIVLTEEWIGRLMKAAPGPYVSLSVTDTGSGIPPEIIDRIFEPFFTTKEIGKGTGLGLATTIGIVKGHGAFLEVTSQVGKGTTFAILFPPADPTAVAQAEKLRSGDLNGCGELILVVEDEELIRTVIETALIEHKYRVLLAENGERGVTLFKKYAAEISVVVIDRMMPVMDGTKAMAVMKQIRPDANFILSTGLVQAADHGQNSGPGKMELLRKPFTTEKLLEVIRSMK